MPSLAKAIKRPILAALVTVLRRDRHFQVRRRAVREKVYLDIGCGIRTHAEFVNLDYGWHRGLDVCWDITRGLPFPDESFLGVFSEHCLEHIALEATDAVIGEILRVLKPGGTVRLVVPDGGLYLTRYVATVAGEANSHMPNASEDGYEGIYSPIMSVNRIFRAHGHQYIYDFDTMRQLLEKHGFSNIVHESFQCGRDPKLLIDWRERAHESLYVEATKPRGT